MSIRGPLDQSGTYLGPSEVCWGHPKAASTTAGQYEHEFVYFRTTFCFQISSPSNIGQKWFCILDLQMDLSF